MDIKNIINKHLELAYEEIMHVMASGDITPLQEDRLQKATDEIVSVMSEVYNQN